MQTLRAGCSKAEPKIFTLPQTPFSGAWDGQNLASWRRSLPSPTNPVWWGSMHTILSYRGNRPTHTPTNKQTGMITIYYAAASTQYNNNFWSLFYRPSFLKPIEVRSHKAEPVGLYEVQLVRCPFWCALLRYVFKKANQECTWGTGIRGLMRGMATLPKVTRSY